MLTQHERQSLETKACRYANVGNLAGFAAAQNLSLDEIAEVVAFDKEDVLRDVFDGPFVLKLIDSSPRYGSPTRYSDGSWPVFYGALEKETAAREVSHHYAKWVGQFGHGTEISFTYTLVSYSFAGTNTVDLRPDLDQWPELVAENYDFCNALGREAIEVGIDAFLAPSARRSGGTALPAFQRSTLSDPSVESLKRFTMSANGSVIDEER